MTQMGRNCRCLSAIFKLSESLWFGEGHNV